jgi:hypothetical protein
VASIDKPGTVRATLGEMKKGSWLANAQLRSSRRKSPWNLILILYFPLWFALWLGAVRLSHAVAALLTHGHRVPDSLVWPGAVAPFFAYFPLMFAMIPTSMMLVNYFIYLFVPPARRAMDEEDKAFPGTEYATQQPIMVRLTLIAFPVALVCAIAGQVFL